MTIGTLGKRWAAGLLLAGAVPGATAIVRPETLAPPFTLILRDGRTVTLASLNGRLVVLNFWATWCAPCRAELAELDRFQRRHPDKVAVFAVLAERRPEPRLVDRQAAAMVIPIVTGMVAGADSYRPINSAVPSTFAIDGEGRLVLARAGALTTGDLDALARPVTSSRVTPSAARSER